ncbi:MAG: hypothetical protein R3C56_04080 [Pirellulaceae bacterium]
MSKLQGSRDNFLVSGAELGDGWPGIHLYDTAALIKTLVGS